MKKTIITLMALAGVATATPQLVWDLDFTNDGIRQNTVGSALTLGALPQTGATIDGAAGSLTLSNQKYVFSQAAGSLTFADEFTMIVQVSLASTSGYPVIFSLGESDDNCFKASYYFTDGSLPNQFVLDMDAKTEGLGSTTQNNKGAGAITYDTTNTPVVTLALHNDGKGTMSFYVNGEKAGYSTFTNTNLTIDDFSLGGRITNDNNKANVTIYDVQLVKGFSTELIPEPTTATLSLLALCGLAARRRRAAR